MTEKPLKKKKVSKKTKRSWRKFVDTTDVDDFLEDQRLEERLGIPFAKRQDTELFAVDKEPDPSLLLTRSEKQLAARKKEPKCFQLLKPLTAVPDPIVKRNRVRTREERRNPIAKKKELLRKANNQLKLKERVALHNKALAEEKRRNRYKRGDYTEDIWAKDQVPGEDLDQGWLTEEIVRHTLNNTENKLKKKPSITKKAPSVLPAIEAPHPGTSYNPTYHDHQSLLSGIVEMERKYEKDEKHLNRVTSRMFKKVTHEQKDADYITEMSEGLNLETKDEETNAAEDNDPTVRSVNPPVKNKKKTLKQRRKQREQRELQLELAKKKLEKKKVADVYKLKRHAREMAKEEKKIEKLRKLRAKLSEKKALEPKSISRVKFEPAEPDYLLSDELRGSLRSSIVTGSVLRDRYKSLQKRNIVAPAKVVLKRSRTKVKKIVKPEHKIDMKAEIKKYMK